MKYGFTTILIIDNKINIKINKMPKVNTLLVNNQFRINTVGSEGEQKYWNAAWVSVHFDSVDVILTDNSIDKGQRYNTNNPYIIALEDFQYDGADLNTESEIADILSDKIG